MNELIKIPNGDPQRASLSLPDGLDFLEWKRIGHSLFGCKDSLQFWIGDWLNYGERNYGDKYSSAVLQFKGEYEIATLHNIASIAKRVPISLRSEILSFGHHAVVASLPESDQKKWLKVAEDEELTVRKLTERIRGRLKDKATDGINEGHGTFYFDAWMADWRMGLKNFPLSQWPDDELETRFSTLHKIECDILAEAERRNLPLAEKAGQWEAA
jgi:hypothetical protein